MQTAAAVGATTAGDGAAESMVASRCFSGSMLCTSRLRSGGRSLTVSSKACRSGHCCATAES